MWLLFDWSASVMKHYFFAPFVSSDSPQEFAKTKTRDAISYVKCIRLYLILILPYQYDISSGWTIPTDGFIATIRRDWRKQCDEVSEAYIIPTRRPQRSLSPTGSQILWSEYRESLSVRPVTCVGSHGLGSLAVFDRRPRSSYILCCGQKRKIRGGQVVFVGRSFILSVDIVVWCLLFV